MGMGRVKGRRSWCALSQGATCTLRGAAGQVGGERAWRALLCAGLSGREPSRRGLLKSGQVCGWRNLCCQGSPGASDETAWHVGLGLVCEGGGTRCRVGLGVVCMGGTQEPAGQGGTRNVGEVWRAGPMGMREG